MGNTTLNGSLTQTISGTNEFRVDASGNVSAAGALSVSGSSTLSGLTAI